MRRLLTYLLAMVAGGGIVFAAFEYHIVRTDEQVLLVAKKQADWRDAYVDIRGWTGRDWTDHPNLVKDLTAAGHGNLIIGSGAGELFRGLFDSSGTPDP